VQEPPPDITLYRTSSLPEHTIPPKASQSISPIARATNLESATSMDNEYVTILPKVRDETATPPSVSTSLLEQYQILTRRDEADTASTEANHPTETDNEV
jgi:hypothetical protein